MAWGLWRVPESELSLLGRVSGLRVLELGCGAARWSAALAQRGAIVVGLDLSRSQLRLALRHRGSRRRSAALVQASATDLPFRAESFDLVFCDWGAMTFADPLATVPECARVLGPNGRLVFATGSPIARMTLDPRADRHRPRLVVPYFGMHGWVPAPGEPREFQMPYGRWVELFVRHGFRIESLLETRPPPRARSTYTSASERGFARSWPLECIWSVRKAGSEPRTPRRAPPRASPGPRALRRKVQ